MRKALLSYGTSREEEEMEHFLFLDYKLLTSNRYQTKRHMICRLLLECCKVPTKNENKFVQSMSWNGRIKLYPSLHGHLH